MTAAKPVTVPSLAAMKADNRPIVMLTTYDASFAQRVDEAGVDVVLVGDSLGNVIQGRDSTLPVIVDDMVYHTRAVKNGLSRALLVTDLPFMSYHDRDSAMRRSEEHTSELQSRGHLVCRLLLEKKKHTRASMY